MPPRAAPGAVLNVIIAAAAVVAGLGLMSAGLAWTPSHVDAQLLSRGAQIYAVACAGCHGAKLEGESVRQRRETGTYSLAPPLDATGHAWQHSNAQLIEIVTHGTRGVDASEEVSGMPAFEERLSGKEIRAVLAYVRSHWPAGLRTYREALEPGGENILATLLRDPSWTFPGECHLSSALTDKR